MSSRERAIDELVTDPCCDGVIDTSGVKSLPSRAYFARDASYAVLVGVFPPIHTVHLLIAMLCFIE